MKPLNIFWIGIFLIVLSGISKQIGWEYMGVGFVFGGIISVLASICVWVAEDT